MNLIAERLNLLRHWISEREKIRIAKERGDASPWTRDTILHTWRFCNVDRCDDRETRWIFKHIIGTHADSPSLWLNLVVARFVNWSPTLETLGYFVEWDSTRFESVIESIKGKAYTGAYMVPAGPAGIPKHVYLARHVFQKLWDVRESRPASGASLLKWSEFLRSAPLCGDFLRNQIVTDYRYCRVGEGAPDWQTFFLPGPGTLRGLNRVYGRDIKSTWSDDLFTICFERLRTELRLDPSLDKVLRDPNNLGNCLCEFDKYIRVLEGEGKPRSRYVPSAEPMP